MYQTLFKSNKSQPLIDRFGVLGNRYISWNIEAELAALLAHACIAQ